MYYEKKITTSNSYTVDQPLETKIKAAEGVLNWVEIEFPHKGAFTVGASLWIGGHPIIPLDADSYVISDGHVVQCQEWIPLKRALNTITIKTYNRSDQYDHDIVVRFTVLKDWQITPWIAIERFVKQMKIFLGHFGMG